MVKCADCGFLSVMISGKAEMIETDETLRQYGNPPKVCFDNGQVANVHPFPICAARKYRIDDECFDVIEANPKPSDGAAAIVLAVVSKDRKCDGFVQWMPNFSPKEHKQMLLELDQKAWQDRRDAADKEFRTAEAKRSRRHSNISLGIAMLGLAVAAYSAFRSKEPQPPPVVNVAPPAITVPTPQIVVQVPSPAPVPTASPSGTSEPVSKPPPPK